MKAKTKLTKLWSFLLSLVMLLSLLPTTALAAYPDASNVFVDGDKSFYDGRLYYKNGDSKDSFSGSATDYNAAYDPTTGTLTLRDYKGGSITAGGNKESKITVVLVGDNFINDGNLNSPYGGDITVTSDSSGTLSITQTMTSSGNAAIGIEAGYGNYETGNVTITGSADVKIKVTHNGTNGHEKAYGIFAKGNITISGGASVDITCATPGNTTGGDHCNGLRADKDVTIDTSGTIKIDVTNAGKDENNGYSFGVYPMGTATLTKVGNMEVKWKKDASNSVNSGGAVYKKGTSLSGTDYAINEDETNCYASYRFGTPYTVTVENGTLAGPGVVSHANNTGNFLAGDTVEIKPSEMNGKSGEVIPFQKWTSEQVTFTSPEVANNSFTVSDKNVTVTAKHNPFDGKPTFKPTGSTGTEGTLTFKTKVKPDGVNEYFRLVKEADKDDESKYNTVLNPNNSPATSPYEYSYAATSGSSSSQVEPGDYYVAEKLNGAWYLSEKFTVNYTAAPTVTYPDSVRVYNANKKLIGLGDGECLTANDATGASSYTGGSSYVARYDKSSGTLYLKDYQGVAADGMIYAHGDLNIVVENDSSFTTSVSATNDLYGIQANGKLTISGTGKLTVTATGRGDVYGIYANEGVTISAPLAVTVGKVDSSKNGPVYGIYAQSGTISLSGNDMTVTATGGTSSAYGVYNAANTSTAITNNGNIDISGKLTVNLSSGSYNRGISSQGGVITLDGATVKIPGNYYYGIFNNNGNVVIKSSPDVDISSDISGNNGICTYEGGDLTIENSTVKVSANGHAANLKGNVSIKDSTVELTLTANYYEVIRTGNSSAANTIDLSGNGSVTLTASGKQEYAMISGKVTATSGTKVEKGTYNSDWKNYKGEYDSASNKTVLKFVHDAPALTANISLSETGTMDFGSMEAGYTTAPAAKTVTITNNGTAATGPLTIALDGANASSFTVSPSNIADVAASGGTGTFTVQPNTGLSAGNYTATVKVSGTGAGVTEKSFDVKFIVTAPLTAIAVPTANSVTYNGTKQTGVNAGTGYTLGGVYEATDVGAADYAATATLETGYKWNDGSTGDKTINWNIGKRTPTVADFDFAAPTDLTYDGNNKTASVTLKSPLSKSGAITVKYEKDSASVTETKNVGTYTVKIDVAVGDNFEAKSDLTDSAWKFSITPANQNAPTGLGVAAPIASGGNGKITGTTTAMEYSTDSGFTSPAGTTCTDTETEVAPGTYYVRLKADANHNAGTVSAALVVPAYSATKYTVTVTSDANGMASADKTANVAAGETVTLTATPNSGYVFDKWDDKTPASLTIGADGKFTMPSENVSVKATFKGAALTGTASITGTLKYGQELTATLTGSNNTGNLDYKWYQNGTTQVAANNTGKYTLRADDIGKTITVKITSSVQTGEITSAATAAVVKADGPAAPSAFTLTFTPNADGTTFTATIPTVTGGEYSFDGTTYSPTNTKTNCTANTSYTGYVRIAATSTRKASAATRDTKTSPKLTVATPTFTPNGASSFTGTQSVTISCATIGAKIYYTTDGTNPTDSSTLYTTTLSLTSTTTVKAIAVNAGMNDSAIATATFTKYSGGGGGGGGSYTPSYTVSVDKTENGTITVSPKSASKGDTVTITVKPDKGYTLETITVTDKNGDEIALTNKGDGKYTFKMPAGKVYVEATFMEDNSMLNFFVDVPADAYYYDAVLWAAKNGITGGVDDTHFAPNATCTRAQVVTFLWRAAGSPAPKNSMMPFTDVPAGSYYEQAVLWAVENGITDGTSATTFSPDAVCSRGQIVTFLWRSQKSPASDSVNPFADVVADDYYNSAVLWAAENGITGGTTATTFSPNNDCTRAQIVTFLYRCLG